MRLLAPAVLLSSAILIGSQSGHAASFLLHSPPGQTATRNTAQSPAGSAISPPASGAHEPGRQPGEAREPATIDVPAGTRITLLLVDPVWAKTVKARDAIYAITAFPVVSNGTMAIPPGTYVLGEIDAVTKPSWKDAHALFQMHFSKIIFANGYTRVLESAPLQAASATVHVQVSSRNDVLLDNGTQFDMILQTPLALDANGVAQAVRRSLPLKFGATKSASMCRPIPATPGTSDTVIPGTPPTPGTPDIVIPGPNGTTTTIPGSPGTPGTSPTIYSGHSRNARNPLPCSPVGHIRTGRAANSQAVVSSDERIARCWKKAPAGKLRRRLARRRHCPTSGSATTRQDHRSRSSANFPAAPEFDRGQDRDAHKSRRLCDDRIAGVRRRTLCSDFRLILLMNKRNCKSSAEEA